MARVLVAGWVGSTNLGDELILAALLRKLRDREASVVAISTSPDATRAEHGIPAVDHRRLDVIDHLAATADAVIFGGGSLVQDLTSRFNLPYHLSRVALARRHGTPVAMVGIGAGPLTTPSGQSLVRRAFDGTVLGSVRDRSSGELVASLGLARPQLAADPAVSLRSPDVDPSDRVVVCLRPWHGGGVLPVGRNWQRGLDEGWFASAMAAALDEVAGRTGLGIHFVALQAGRDDELHRVVADRMKTAATQSSPGLSEVLDEVAASRAVVTLRYHGAVAAALGSRPAVLVGYTDKVSALAADLGRGVRDLGWSPEGVAEIPDALDEVLGREDDVADALRRLRVRELGNDDAIDRLLEAGSAA